MNTTSGSPAYPGPPTLLDWIQQLGDRFRFHVNGSFGASYVIQANPDLSAGTWTSLSTNAAPFSFTQTNASSYEQRSYRTVYFR